MLQTLRRDVAKGGADDFITFYHKGNLENGALSPRRGLSTVSDEAIVNQIQRSGPVHKFKIPKKVLMEWKMNFLIEEKNVIMQENDLQLKETIFSTALKNELYKYMEK